MAEPPKMELLQTKASEPFSTEPEASQPDDLTVPDLSITQSMTS